MDPIRVKGISKVYGSVEALADVDLTVEPDTFHCIVGPNSSGKTTLFEIILKLTKPSRGEVSVPNADFGCSYQKPKFYNDLTVEENLRVFSGMTAGQNEGWIDKVNGIFDFGMIANKKSSKLSAGNAKKLDLALSLIKKPDFLLLDEPLSSLDEESSLSFLEFLREENVGGIVVFSHRLSPFSDLLDKLTILKEGKVIFDETHEAAAEEGYEDLQEIYEASVWNEL